MIYIIITTSINNKVGIHNESHRKKRYIECIQSLLTLIEHDNTFKPIIVENNEQRFTYLDEMNCDIIYTNNNICNCKHKGVNELLDIKQVITQYNINDNDIIIKLTGRYKILDMSFLNLVKDNCNIYDAFVKFFNVCELKFMENDCVLGLFAIKCKYLKDFEYENEYIRSPEVEFAEYVKENLKEKTMEINTLNLECCFADDLRLLIV
jgi:hypothetical protein